MQPRKNQTNSRGQSSNNSRNQSPVTIMIQRCHKWRMKRKQYMDQARLATDEIERERLLQSAEHYGRIVNEEQAKIDSTRAPGDKTPIPDVPVATENGTQSGNIENSDTDEEQVFPTFLTSLN
jgi:hypothetical protein